MQPPKRILVDIDATAAAHPALERALRLARRWGARLRIVDVLHLPGSALRYLRPRMQEQLVSERRERLVEIQRGTTDLAVDVDVLLGRPAPALIQEVLRSEHDLLIRSHVRDTAARETRLYGSVDMQLFRDCPCPVLAVGPGAPRRAPRILAAVNADPDDPVEQRLNTKLLELGLLVTEAEGGSLTILQAWSVFGATMVRSRTTAEEFTAYLDQTRDAARAGLKALTDPFGARLAEARIELRHGEAEDVIPEFVVAEGIDLVVMGTVARTGIAGLLIGNTAERLLQRLPCSVLAVKPDGFRSPLAAAAP